jgi:hypothetical protein
LPHPALTRGDSQYSFQCGALIINLFDRCKRPWIHPNSLSLNPSQDDLVPLQSSFGKLKASLNRSFVLYCVFRTFYVRSTGFLLTVIQLFLQPVSLLLQPLMMGEMVVLKLDPILLLALLLRV